MWPITSETKINMTKATEIPALQFNVMTTEQLKEFGLVCIQLANQMPSVSYQVEPIYCLRHPIIAEKFPSTKLSTLKRACMDGKLGKMGVDGKYYVTIKEINKYLFK